MNDLQLQIKTYLYNCGVRPHLKGFRALMYAIGLCLDDEDYLFGVCKGLYCDVGVMMGISGKAVERNIRVAIMRACDNNAQIAEVVGFWPDGKAATYPNMQFIAAAVENLRRD